MLAGDSLKWVTKALITQRVRSLLTLLGMAIGIAAVALLSSLGEGLRNYVLQEFTQFGSHLLAVTPGKTETFGLGGVLNTVRPMSLQDAQSLQRLAGVEAVVPVVFGTSRLEVGNRARHANVAGVGSAAADVWKLDVAQGRFLPAGEMESPRALAVIGSKIQTELFGHNSALGEFINIGGARFRVVGILKPKGQFLGTDLDDAVYIPVAKGLELFNRESLMEIDIVYQEKLSTESISRSVKQHLIQRHGLEDFTIITQDQVLDSLDSILSMLKYVGAGLGAISLLVGGVGIFTIMLITTAERTREIGLLLALGFTGGQIRNLFLAEAVLLALAGGIAGLLFTGLVVVGISWTIPNLPLQLTSLAIIVSLSVSALIGILAGTKPAIDAARLSPIDALRQDD